ncbi:tripartite tricarboxylate transporter substrate binding protein [Paracoccus sediminis]|uniref:Tripartite tricarboxylate transporter substrate binding protein n=1 Tax=Paracoccus sediminis TaxID=1214787 RepID=A0A238WLJ1_9RHOB|nr:tripartite tricarboxylate transporter substrate binding protein [Paracoccus sediminis]TBN50516.1 tripartite tricarboxylate transporter substrate binding protein [Paracoccus sediminis]SNR47104.1 Tripartite-type tricarboxylate transporter, receptor component TctC [Paracoccus sediminis]
MTMTKAGLLAATAMMLAAPASAQFAPSRPVEFVVASGAGGGTDNFARTIQSVLTRDGIMDNPIVVLNKGGGSGAEAFLYARQNEGDPHKLIFGTNNVYLLPHVAKLAYTTEDLQPVAALALDEFLVWVKADSPYQTVMDLVNAAKDAPGTIPFGGSQSKDTDETLVALIEQTTGADFKYVPFNGGGEVGVQLAGGHVAANVNNPNENVGQWQAGAIRPLCVFAPERMAESEPVSGDMGWHDIPTCAEQGLDITSYQMPRTVWLPAGTDPEVLAYYQDALQKVSESQDWKDYLAKTSQSATFMTGEELAAFIDASEADAVKVFEAEGWTVQ